MFVKICGITNEDDALLAVAMGASAVGFIFAPSSRQVPPVRAGDIAKRLPSEVLTVGVFRNEAPKRVVEIVNRYGMQAAQLHGHETQADTEWIKDRVPRIIKAFPAGSPEVARASEWKSNPILVDAPRPGSGETFDWALLDAVPEGLRVVLAGGLGPDNVAEAIRTVRPWGVDVASGVERSPGKKDPVALRDFVANARGAFESLAPSGPPPDVVAHDKTEVPLYDWRLDG